MSSKILTAHARLQDGFAMNALVSPIPNGEELLGMLKRGFEGRTQAYDREGRTGRYVISDGSHVTCFTVTDLTIEQAAIIAAECDAIETWNQRAFNSAVERALGVSLDHIQ